MLFLSLTFILCLLFISQILILYLLFVSGFILFVVGFGFLKFVVLLFFDFLFGFDGILALLGKVIFRLCLLFFVLAS